MKMSGRLGLGASTLLSLGLMVGAAHAEEPKAGADATAGAAADPDVVRLKNGGMLRGKISELIPGDTVTIVTVTGKTREIKMSEVDYAGPAAKDPQGTAAEKPVAEKANEKTAAEDDSEDVAASNKEGKPQSYVTVHGKEARLHVVSTEPGITLHRQASAAFATGGGVSAFATGYERMCTAPCDVSLPAGTETLALSRGDKPPISAEPVTLPPGNSEVRASFESRSGLRVAGWLLLLGSSIGGLALVFTSASTKQDCSTGPSYCHETSDLNAGQMIAGVALASVGAGVGVALAVLPDKPVIEVASSGPNFSRPLSVPRGVTVSGRF
jgi:hypothetical protein